MPEETQDGIIHFDTSPVVDSVNEFVRSMRGFSATAVWADGAYRVEVATPPEPTLHACAMPGCEVQKPLGEMTRTAGAYYCSEHVAVCRGCHGTYRADSLHAVRRRRTSEEQMYCSNCSHECASCHEWAYYADTTHTFDGYLCRNCRTSCEECGNYTSPNTECSYCSSRVRGLNGYGKTYPDIWLGGPLPKNKKGVEKGYYLGFELEVSATKGHVRVLNDWAGKNLTHPNALESKEDSSVNGFEIVTQPMTPQFFESVDWEDFFKVLNNAFPLPNRKRTEPESHGLHVHIGKVAFANDDIAMAAFCYLIGQSSHLERIARRKATTYCKKVEKPVSSAIRHVNYSTGRYQNQASRAAAKGIHAERSAINLLNSSTIEIRAFRSTRKASDLRDAVRLVYVAAEYIRHLRFVDNHMPPKALHWTEFAKWVGGRFPEAFESISGMRSKPPVRG